ISYPRFPQPRQNPQPKKLCDNKRRYREKNKNLFKLKGGLVGRSPPAVLEKSIVLLTHKGEICYNIYCIRYKYNEYLFFGDIVLHTLIHFVFFRNFHASVYTISKIEYN